MGLGTVAQLHYPRLWVAGVEVARDVALAAVVVVPGAAPVLVNVRVLPRLDAGRVLREEHAMHIVVHAVVEAQVLAHVLPEGHGVTRDFEVVKLATPTVAGVKEAKFGDYIFGDDAIVEYHNDIAEQLFGEIEKHARLDVLMVHDATSSAFGHVRVLCEHHRGNTPSGTHQISVREGVKDKCVEW